MFARFLERSAPASSQSGSVRMIDAATARTWAAAGEAVIVDVREAHEFAGSHIAEAVSMPLSRFDPARLPDLAGRKLVIHCRSGMRCGLAADRLLASGWTGQVHRLQGGIMAWSAAGYPLQAG